MVAAATGYLRRLGPLGGRWIPPLGVLVLVGAVWETGAHAAQNLLLPSLTATIRAFFDLTVGGVIWEPLARSNLTMAVGYLASVLIGIPLGLAMGRHRGLDRTVTPYVGLLVVVPVAPLLPIVVMVVGFGMTAGTLVVALFTVAYVLVNTRAGIRSIDERLIEMARSFGASEFDIWRFVLLPGALPAIGAGLRIGLGRAFAGMVLSELLLLSSGIGLLILEYRGRFDSARLFAVVLVLLLEAMAIAFVMRRVERSLQGLHT